MSKLIAETEEQQKKVCEIGIKSSMWIDKSGEGVHNIDYISFDVMADIVDYLRSQQDNGQDEYKNFCDHIKVGDTFLCHSNKCAFSGEVNHIDGRDVLIVIGGVVDPLPIILPAVETKEATEIGNMQVGGELGKNESFDINQMRKEFKELAAKWREKAGDADISVNVWSHTRENPVLRYDAVPIIIDINCNVSVNELEL